MKELSLHVLDIVENSVAAGAHNILVDIEEDSAADTLRITVEDDGKGMDDAMEKAVLSPFTTSRTTRKVGLGIPMFKEGAELTGGSFKLESEVGRGTAISATYGLTHIDRVPLGNIADTVVTMVVCNPDLDFIYRHTVDGRVYELSTREMREVLGPEVPLNLPEVATFIKENINEGIAEISNNGGLA